MFLKIRGVSSVYVLFEVILTSNPDISLISSLSGLRISGGSSLDMLPVFKSTNQCMFIIRN